LTFDHQYGAVNSHNRLTGIIRKSFLNDVRAQ
jgi:hypothetical protein